MQCGNCFKEIPESGLTATYADEDKEIIMMQAACACGAKHFKFIGEDEFDWDK